MALAAAPAPSVMACPCGRGDAHSECLGRQAADVRARSASAARLADIITAPDLSSCDHYLWSRLKEKVYAHPFPATEDEMRDKIMRVAEELNGEFVEQWERENEWGLQGAYDPEVRDPVLDKAAAVVARVVEPHHEAHVRVSPTDVVHPQRRHLKRPGFDRRLERFAIEPQHVLRRPTPRRRADLGSDEARGVPQLWLSRDGPLRVKYIFDQPADAGYMQFLIAPIDVG